MKFDINSLIENYFLLNLEVTKIRTQLLRNRTPTKSNKNEDLECQFFSNDTQGTYFYFFCANPSSCCF